MEAWRHRVRIYLIDNEFIDWTTRNLKEWNRSFEKHISFVAVENKQIVGFGDIDKTSYLDRLFVLPDYQRMGIGTAICIKLEEAVQVTIVTHASISAKSFFEKRGYRVVKEQKVERQGVFLTNFVMEYRYRLESDDSLFLWRKTGYDLIEHCSYILSFSNLDKTPELAGVETSKLKVLWSLQIKLVTLIARCHAWFVPWMAGRAISFSVMVEMRIGFQIFSFLRNLFITLMTDQAVLLSDRGRSVAGHVASLTRNFPSKMTVCRVRLSKNNRGGERG